MAIMVSSTLVLLFVAAIFRIISQAVAQPAFLYHSCLDDDRDNFISDSTYKANLNHLLHSISNSTEIINNGFYNSSYGSNINEVHAIGLCRGDVQLDVCRGCLYNASYLLPELCPDHKEAIGWYDHCMLRYSNRSILGVIETSPNFTIWGINNVSANYADQFFDVARSLLERLRSRAAASYSLRKFAAGNAAVSNFKTIYALVQCTPDLSEQECNDCLLGASEGIPRCCDGKEGGRIARPSCDIRFEVYPFYYSTTNSPPPAHSPIPTDHPQKSPTNKGTLYFIPILASITFLGLISSIAGIYIRAKRGRKKIENEIIGSILFDFDNIKVATNNFSEANKLRESEFGTVYKGTFSNKVITVKRLSTGFGHEGVEFEDKVLSLTKLRHGNIVELLGCSVEGNERLLIYDFVPNTSLDHYLSDPLKLATLDWEMRYKIIRGIAQGVLYLHEKSELCFNHGLEASNIFVDEEMNPKISEFGLKSLLSLDQIPENTSRIERIEEAPDVMHLLFAMMSDVFNFGVLVLEIVSGQKNNCFRDEENADTLLSYARRNFSQGTASNIIDPTILMPDGSTSEIINCILTALLCAEANEADRPTMASVVTMLDGTDKHGSMETEMPSFEDDHRVLGRRTFLRRVRSLFWTKKGGFRVLES
ncbi:cysteine-rich receptor-like protein kinase 26 [Juglans microcarpa x Juglans regia]|uniref:cysteine-rich receptor-like protein kinase 26 n=1 Tax=Juglans microcarpa x Juglans regia TaxID=2249226 RepID=UPI001B7EB0E4|nr:cysteine-rich receptor-like protein kinase 26 [Juglans microcarpa x Juglans regia]XP_041023211.1 cysteine-rich receptor-like protein kinase 26 [Juglans microcarpa x Juglans regia]